MVLVAHPDDETLGCGATVARLANEGWDVDVVILTDGIITARGGDPVDNRDQCEQACEILGIKPPTLLGFPDQQLDRESLTDLSTAVTDLGRSPDLIITHSDHDLNVDHRLTAEVARIVARPLRKPVALLACEIPANTSWNGVAFPATYFVDVTETLDAKLDAFARYADEVQPPPSPLSLDGIRQLAEYHGRHVGVGAAEAFTLIRGIDGRLP